MPGMSEGIAVGLGEGLGDIAGAIHERRAKEAKDRDKQADDLTEQIKSIADNIAKAGGKDSPDAAPMVDQLHQAVKAHNDLFPAHESPALIQRIQKMMGHKPGAAKPDVRTLLNPDRTMAAAQRPTNNILQDVNNLAQVYMQGDSTMTMDVARKKAFDDYIKKNKLSETWKEAPGAQGQPTKGADGKWYQLQVSDQGTTRNQPLPEGYVPDEGWKPQDGEAGKPFKDPKDSKIYQMQVNKQGNVRRVEMEGMSDTALHNKPLEAKTNSMTGGLESITDPNSGSVYTKSSIASAPPEVQKMWGDVTGQVEEEQKRKSDLEDKKTQAAEERQLRTITAALERQEQSFKNTLATKDYGEARKIINTADTDYQNGIDRLMTMDKNLSDAMKGDQQAMLSLVANHIGMTLGAQKGARITRAAFDEAVQSAPWLSKVTAKWSADGYLSGVTLAPEQMKQMVRLAREKVDVLKDHKHRVEDEYHDVVNPRPNAAPAPAAGAKPGAAPAAAGKKPANADEYLKSIGHH